MFENIGGDSRRETLSTPDEDPTTSYCPSLTRGELGIVDSALYKALHRLEDAGAVSAEWGASENNRRAKYYAITPRGRQMLRSEVATWKRFVATISTAIEPG